MFIQGKCVADFFLLKRNHFCFSLKKVCDALSLEKHRGSAKETGTGTGKGTGRELGKREGTGKTQHFVHAEEKELEKQGNWKNTAFSIAPGKGNWKNSIFNHAQEREQQQQEEEQQEEEQQQQEQEQKQVGRTNTDVKQKNALAQYLSVHHH